jgi:uncharacterized protein (UPF0548 family)
MFSLLKPAERAIQRDLEIAGDLPLSYGIGLNTEGGPEDLSVPRGFVCDHTRTEIGHGIEAFHAARAAFLEWRQFDLGWVRVANPEASIKLGQIVAVEARALGLWSVNFSRILYATDEPARFGFGYGTTPLHVERGEERFLLEFFPKSGAVYYDLLAVSQPANLLARLGFRYTRSRQRRFAIDSHRRMRRAVIESFPRL